MTLDSGDETDLLNSSLTNLQWLQHINMNLSDGLSVPRKTVASSSYNSSTAFSSVKGDRHFNGGGIDYTRNSVIKPPYSYATLICMAIRETPKHKITLSAIYNWIMANFAYYRHADPSWQNSIRHNLSLNKCFLKVPRDKDEPGKGGFWMINSDYENDFKNGVFKRRKPKKMLKKSPYNKASYRLNIYNPGKIRQLKTGYQKIEICDFSNPPQHYARSAGSGGDSVLKMPTIDIESAINSGYHQPKTNFLPETNSNTSNVARTPATPLHVQHHPPHHTHFQQNVMNPIQVEPQLTLPNIKLGPTCAARVSEEHHALDLVLKDIQLNSCNNNMEAQKKTEDDIFKPSDFNWESLTEDITSPELNELVRDIESLIDTPTFTDSELIIKGEKLNSVVTNGSGSGAVSDWGGILDDININIGSNLDTDYLDTIASIV